MKAPSRSITCRPPRPPGRRFRSVAEVGVAGRLRGFARGRSAKLLAVGLLTVAMAALAGTAPAAVPTTPPSFPDNLVVFPDRDFLSAEGFDDYVGQNALVEVTRPVVGRVGAAEVTLGPGGVPFEINHPGGFCWGNDLGARADPPFPNVTPDVLPGDVVKITFADGSTSEIITQDAFVTGVSAVSDAPAPGQDQNFRYRLTVTGRLGPTVPRDPVTGDVLAEQRIVNPDLTGTLVGRRDIRAVPGGFTPDRNAQYLSNLEVSGEAFTATYLFLDQAVATIAATGGGERLLSWQVTDADANRQGITIAEFGEVGGPGMGGCPNGPLQAGPAGPTGVNATRLPNGNIRVDWTPAVAIPGTPPIIGYRVHAVAQTSTNNEQIEIGRRIARQAATGTTINGLSDTETYDVFVVSVNSVGETVPAIHADVVADATPPVVTASPNAGSYTVPQNVRLSADQAGTQIFFTTDGSDVLDAVGDPTLGATPFTVPIPISVDTTVKFAAFDPSGNVSTGEFSYTITNTPVPATPTFGSATVGNGSISLTWYDVNPDPSIIEYDIQVYDAAQDGNAVGGPHVVSAAGDCTQASPCSTTITGLQADTHYWVTIRAQNANGHSPESARLGPLTPQGPVVANAGPDQTVNRGALSTTFNLTGAGSTDGATYLWEKVSPAGQAVSINTPGALNTGVTLPAYSYLASGGATGTAAIRFRLTVTTAAGSDTDEVVVSAVPDRVAITSAQWKNNDFRVNGTGNVNGAVITVHRGGLNGPALGTAPVVAGAFTLRLRNAQTPQPAVLTITIESTAGGTVSTPFTVQQR
jgi:Chitobiase/beta-hexosaminidase C-terminal domain/Fibronectin type III domain